MAEGKKNITNETSILKPEDIEQIKKISSEEEEKKNKKKKKGLFSIFKKNK